MYHIQKALDSHAQEIKSKNRALAGLREEQRRHDKALEDARGDQAKARTAVMQKEKKIKKAEKALELRVCITFGSLYQKDLHTFRNRGQT